MRKLTFPANNGIEFDVEISENANVVTIPDFDFVLLGELQHVTGGSFEMAPGDTIFITPNGLEHSVYVVDINDPAKGSCPNATSVYTATGAAYWLVSADSKSGEITTLEVA